MGVVGGGVGWGWGGNGVRIRFGVSGSKGGGRVGGANRAKGRLGGEV